MKIPFNKPHLTGKELKYIEAAIQSGKIAGGGIFTKKCQAFFQEKYGFRKVLLTTTATAALEMAAILVNIQPGDEVIAPSYTHVSTVNPFVLRGAKIVFADCLAEVPNIDIAQVESLLTPRTKAIVPMHYAGIACDMQPLMDLARQYNLYIIEDAAQSLDAYYGKNPLGSIGHLAAFSFHETKNISCGEGGMLVVNEESLERRAELIWEKGTNRVAFFRGEVEKYEWLDTGSSFAPAEIIAAFLYAQLEKLEDIQQKRQQIWRQYQDGLKPLEKNEKVKLPAVPHYARHNAHLFYLVCNSREERDRLIAMLKAQGVAAYFHFLSLHTSPFYRSRHDGRELPNCDHFAGCLLRLPLFYELNKKEIAQIIAIIVENLNSE